MINAMITTQQTPNKDRMTINVTLGPSGTLLSAPMKFVPFFNDVVAKRTSELLELSTVMTLPFVSVTVGLGPAPLDVAFKVVDSEMGGGKVKPAGVGGIGVGGDVVVDGGDVGMIGAGVGGAGVAPTGVGCGVGRGVGGGVGAAVPAASRIE